MHSAVRDKAAGGATDDAAHNAAFVGFGRGGLRVRAASRDRTRPGGVAGSAGGGSRPRHQLRGQPHAQRVDALRPPHRPGAARRARHGDPVLRRTARVDLARVGRGTAGAVPPADMVVLPGRALQAAGCGKPPGHDRAASAGGATVRNGAAYFPGRGWRFTGRLVRGLRGSRDGPDGRDGLHRHLRRRDGGRRPRASRMPSSITTTRRSTG